MFQKLFSRLSLPAGRGLPGLHFPEILCEKLHLTDRKTNLTSTSTRFSSFVTGFEKFCDELRENL